MFQDLTTYAVRKPFQVSEYLVSQKGMIIQKIIVFVYNKLLFFACASVIFASFACLRQAK